MEPPKKFKHENYPNGTLNGLTEMPKRHGTCHWCTDSIWVKISFPYITL